MSNSFSDFVGSELRASPNTLDRYWSALTHAYGVCPPPYGQSWFGQRFREQARDPWWLAGLLASDAQHEGTSALRLHQFAGSIADSQLSVALKKHSRDEAKHSIVFRHVLSTLFPESCTPALDQSLRPAVPRSTAGNARGVRVSAIFPTVVLVNLFEIKALVLVSLLRPVVDAYCEQRQRPKIQKAMAGLIRDEVSHIRYTAEWIENNAIATNESSLHSIVVAAQAKLNKLTLDDLAQEAIPAA